MKINLAIVPPSTFPAGRRPTRPLAAQPLRAVPGLMGLMRLSGLMSLMGLMGPMGLMGATAPAQAQTAATETWRLAAVHAAPWGTPLGTAPAPGQALRVTPRALHGPSPLNCPGATHRFLRTPPQGLFEGQLDRPGAAPAPARSMQLGLPAGALTTQRISCANASFDLHRDGTERAWTALDNRVLQWQRVEADATPESAVQALLLRHLAGDMALTRESLAAKAETLTPRLQAQLARWLARPQRADEVPDIAGDPFSNTQEYPDAFSLAPARVQAERAEVSVTFTGAALRPSKVRMLLRRVGNGWRVDDLGYPDGSRLSQLLGGG